MWSEAEEKLRRVKLRHRLEIDSVPCCSQIQAEMLWSYSKDKILKFQKSRTLMRRKQQCLANGEVTTGNKTDNGQSDSVIYFSDKSSDVSHVACNKAVLYN